MRVGSAAKFALMLLLALSFVFLPGLVPVPVPPGGPLGNQGITVASAVAGYSSIYSIRNLSSADSASYLHDFVNGAGTHSYYSPSDIAASGSQIYFARDISDSTLPSGLYTLTVNSDQELSALFIGNESSAGPTTGIVITPTAGSAVVGVPITFTAYYMNGRNGTTSSTQYLKGTYLAIRDSSLANAIYLKYDPVANKIYLRNDANSAWLGGYAPGSANDIANSQGAVLAGATSRTWSANKRLLTMEWSVVFKASYAGSFNLYACATESTDASCATLSEGAGGWSNKGGWTVEALDVTPVSVQPNSGTSGIYDPVLFTTVFQDTNGAADIAEAEFQISPSDPSAENVAAFYGRYVPSSNVLYVKHAGEWSSAHTPGTAGTPNSGSFKLGISSTSVISAGNMLTVTWAVVPQGIQSGYGLYLRAEGDSGETGDWSSSYGTRNVTYRSVPVTATQETTTSSLNRTHMITTVYSDTTSSDNIGTAFLLLAPTASGAPFLARFDQSSSTFYLCNTNTSSSACSGSAWLPATIGITDTVENNYFRIYVNSSEVITEGTDLTINWAIRPLSQIRTYNLNLAAADYNSNFSGSRSGFGTWTVAAGQSPTGDSVAPVNGRSDVMAGLAFDTVFGDPDGADDIANAYFQLRPASGAATTLVYSVTNNLIYIQEGTGALTGGFAPGASEILTTTDFLVDVSATSVVVAGNNVTPTWSMLAQAPSVDNTYSLYLRAIDASGRSSGSSTVPWGASHGTWSINYRAVGVSAAMADASSSINNVNTVTTVYTGTTGAEGTSASRLAKRPILAGSDLIGKAFLRIARAGDAASFYAYYEPASDTFNLCDSDFGSCASAARGGETATLANDYFILHVDQTTVDDDGETLTVEWAIEPLWRTAAKTFSLAVRAADSDDIANPWKTNSGWTWAIASNQRPAVGDLQPNAGSSDVGRIRSLTAVYSDLDGATNLSKVGLELRTAGARRATVVYDLNNDEVSINNRVTGAWLRLGAPGASTVDGNGIFNVDLADTQVISAGNVLTVTWAIQPLGPAVNKPYTMHLYAEDDAGQKSASGSGWSPSKGNWFVNYRAVPVSLTQEEGTSSKNRQHVVTTVYSDTTDAEDIAQAWLRASAGNVNTRAFVGYFDRDSDAFYLANDTYTGWFSGTTGTVANSYFSLDIDASAVEVSTADAATSLTINWAITPLAPAAGKTYGLYLSATDADGTGTPWISSRNAWDATWRVVGNQKPATGDVTPNSGSSGSGLTRTFETTFSDPDGADDLAYAFFEITTGGSTVASGSRVPLFHGRYNAATNQISIRNAANTAWTDGLEPGSAETLANDYFSLDVASTSVISDETTLTITWAVTPIGDAVNRAYNLYLSAQDAANAGSGWGAKKGTWYVNYRAVPVDFSPASTNAIIYQPATLTTVYSDTEGSADIAKALLNLSVRSVNASGFQAYYDQTNAWFAVYNAGEWITGTTGTLESANFNLDIDASTVVTAGDFMTVTWSLTPSGPASGKTFNAYLQAYDAEGTFTPWRAPWGGSRGTVRVGANSRPTTGSLDPNSGTTDVGTTRQFTAVYGDPNGFVDVKWADLALAAYGARYDAVNNILYIRNNANSGWLEGGEPGSSGTVANRYFSLDLATTAVISADNVMTVTWAIQPLADAAAKPWTLGLNVTDRGGAATGVVAKGSIFVNYRAVPVNASPSSGTSYKYDERTITTVYSSTTTADDIVKAWLRASVSTLNTNAFYAYYDQALGEFNLRNAANTEWFTGTAGILNNDYFWLDIDSSSVTTTNNLMTITWSIIPLHPASGKKYNLYMSASDGDGTQSPFVDKGDWIIAANRPPTRGAFSPTSGSSARNEERVFTATFNDPDGTDDFAESYFLVSTSPTTFKNAFYARYDALSNLIYLRNSANSAWSDGYAPGSSNVISNTMFSLNVEGTTVVRAGTAMTITWAVTPFAASTVNKTYSLYRSAKDIGNKDTALRTGKGGTWRITAAIASLDLNLPGLPSIRQLAAALLRRDWLT